MELIDGVEQCRADIAAWYYDDPVNPTKIVACPHTCKQIKKTLDFFQIMFGCD